MAVERIHRVAYRCRDAGGTVRFYHGLLAMKYTMAISEDRVPSTQEPDSPAMGRDPGSSP